MSEFSGQFIECSICQAQDLQTYTMRAVKLANSAVRSRRKNPKRHNIVDISIFKAFQEFRS
jgi:hypothetical protein